MQLWLQLCMWPNIVDEMQARVLRIEIYPSAFLSYMQAVQEAVPP